MKIYPGHTPKSPVIEPAKSGKGASNKGVSKATFEAILNEKKGAADVVAPQELTPTGQVSPISATHKAQEEALSYANESLDLLSHLERVLTDDKSLLEKRLQGIEAVMRERVQGLLTLRNELSVDDPLRETVNRVGVQMAVEAYKIHRGDYSSG